MMLLSWHTIKRKTMSNNSRSNKAINRANPVHGLEKIPTHILLKYSRQEVGELKAYIDELEYENEMLREKLHQKENSNE